MSFFLLHPHRRPLRCTDFYRHRCITGLTIRSALRQLKPMATSVRRAYSRVRIIICGTIAN